MSEPKPRKKHAVTKGYIGVEGLMELLGGRSRRTINTMISENRLPKPDKDGRRIVWKEHDIKRWIANEKHFI